MAWEISLVELPGIVSDTMSDVDFGVAERFRKVPLSITLHPEICSEVDAIRRKSGFAECSSSSWSSWTDVNSVD